MSNRFDITFDSLVPSQLARFWAAALDGYAVRAYDEQEIRRLASLGFTPETDPGVAVDGPGPTFFFQMSGSATTSRNRIHIDIRVSNRPLEVERLMALGARIRDEHNDHTVLLDPEGNQFCVVDS